MEVIFSNAELNVENGGYVFSELSSVSLEGSFVHETFSNFTISSDGNTTIDFQTFTCHVSDRPGLISIFDVAGTIAYSSLAIEGGLVGARMLGQRLLFGSANRVFWSGGVAEAAASLAASTGSHTLEMTLAGRGLIALTNATSFQFTRPLWSLASRGFASGARGTVNVIINPTRLRATSIWLNTERAILQANKVRYKYHFIF